MKLLFDFGGTKIRFAISEDNKTLQNIQIYPSIQNYQKAIEFIKDRKDEITLSNDIEEISGGIAGVVQNNVLFNAPHLHDWNQKSLSENLKAIFKAKSVVIKNDAALAALAEAVKGAGKDYSIVAYLTLGTGVGGARVVNKKLDDAFYGFEPGHQIISGNANLHLTFEDLASGSGIQKRYGKNPFEIEDKKIWDEIEEYIAIGLNNTVLMWSPEVIILGGGIANSNLIDIQSIQNKLENLIKVFPRVPVIKKSELGEEVGLYGALLSTIIT